MRAWLQFCATRPRFLALAAFLFAGDLKADPRLAWVPVDLTLLTGSILVAVLALRVARGARPASRPALALLGVWWLTFLPGVAGAVDSPYTFQKVGTLFTFSLLAALAPLWLLEEPGDLRRLVNAMAYFCLAITLAGLLGGGAGAASAERLQAFGAGTISLGRASGLLFLLAALALEDGPLGGLTFGIMALAGVTALFSGSRGPIVSALLALGLLAVVGRRGVQLFYPFHPRSSPSIPVHPRRQPRWHGSARRALAQGLRPTQSRFSTGMNGDGRGWKGIKALQTRIQAGSPAMACPRPVVATPTSSSWLKARAGRRLMAAGALAGVVSAALSLAPEGSLRRLDSFFRGQYGSSELYRVQALRRAWDLIPDAPAGLGWGRFATHVDPEKGLDRQYPHNLLAEVTLEGGWLCGAATLAILLTGAAAAWSRTASAAGRIAFTGLLFYLANALVSGDVNDNRPLFMFISSALALLEGRP